MGELGLVCKIRLLKKSRHQDVGKARAWVYLPRKGTDHLWIQTKGETVAILKVELEEPSKNHFSIKHGIAKKLNLLCLIYNLVLYFLTMFSVLTWVMVKYILCH